MNRTGFTAERAEWHDTVAIPIVIAFLEDRHHEVDVEDLNGHSPDLRVDKSSYLDVKTRMSRNCHTGNFSIEVDSAAAYNTLPRVFIAFICESDPSIIRIERWRDVRARLGPVRPATESNDDYYLVPMLR